MGKKIKIIGAGIAGLSAGCYLQMNGYDTEIYELYDVPGGLCSSWNRKGYTIEGCIHWLVSSSPTDNFYYLWSELIDMKSIKFVDYEEYMRVEGKDGAVIRVFTDINKLEKEFLEKAPEDRELILEFTNIVRKFLKLKRPIEKAYETYNLIDTFKVIFKFAPYFKDFRKWSRISIQEYADRCKNILLKKTFELMFVPEMTILFLIMTLAWMHKKSAGYPIGGSLEFARLIEKRYLELGGKINYNSKVEKIIVENNSAKGIMLENGEKYEADIVISAADGYYTIFKMLDGKYIDKKIIDLYDNYETFPSYVQVSLGIARTFEDVPHLICFPLEKSLIIDEDSKFDYIGFRIFNFDPTLAPQRRTLITSMFLTSNYKYWCELREKNREKYKAEKERIAREVIEILENKYGNIKSNIEMVDVSTPATVIRYTNNWKGSFEGWLLTPKMGMKKIKKVLPGLKNFYMVGQWVEPGGGLPSSLLSGRNVAQIICKRDKKKFITIKK